MPVTIAFVPRPDGGKTMTSYFALRLLSFASCCVLVYVNGTLALSNAIRHQPSVCVDAHVWTIATRGARSGCVLTDGAEPTAVTCRPRSAAAFCMSEAETFLMMKDPRLNFFPAASNPSSAASNDASLN